MLTRVAKLPEGIRFSEENMFRLTLLAWEMGDPEFGVLCTLAYHFLLRVPSEGLPLEAGTPGELLAPLPEGRHSAIAVVEGRLHMRLKSRKNRPQGSILVRECCCKTLQEPRLCPVHCYDWENQVGGTKLFTYSSMAAKMRLRRFASLLGLPGAQQVTLKIYRASKATALALQGKPVHQILEAGEWRSAAVLKYAAPEALDAGALLTQTVENDDSD